MSDGRSTSAFDTVIAGGLVFDGRGSTPIVADVGVRDGRVVAIERELPRDGANLVDARDRWVTPGFIDLHTHYDAEIEVAPGLSESVRHGVTSVVVGSCSLSLAVGTPDDLADMFCRVEAIPDRFVRPVLHERKSWNTHAQYLDHLDALPLGPNVAAFAGHSAMRAHAMGLERSLSRARPTHDEMNAMERMLEDALDAGYLGCSLQTLPWDKMGGTGPFRSRPLPSTFARWSEYRRLTRILRRRGAVLQGVPNISTKANTILFMLESAGLFGALGRAPLKTTIISLMDPRAQPGIHRYAEALSRFFNRNMRADFRWQALPNLFDLWADGVDLVVFEEFGAGTAALHLQDALERSELLRDAKYRAWFRKQWTSKVLPRAFHRDFNRSQILACPDSSVVGKSFAQLAQERGEHVVDTFLDLAATHGDRLRWYTVMCNERKKSIEEIVSYDDVLIGFSDAGAHLRQMAHYNFPLRLLKLVRDAHDRNEPIMTVERAVHRVTGEIADWLGFDAGHLEEGARADLVVVNPAGLGDDLERAHYASIDGFGDDYQRLVRRNDNAVDAVFIAGKQVVSAGKPLHSLGRDKTGRVLRRLVADDQRKMSTSTTMTTTATTAAATGNMAPTALP